MTQERPVVGRFAPSPSGRMHLGNAFSALIAWLAVRSAGGEMVLRQEDLDPQRCKREYADQIEEDYRWLGLDWDRGGSAGGDAYYQSNRDDIYAEALETLRQNHLIYPCFCTRNQLHAASAPHATDGTTLYPGTCRNLTPAEQTERAKTRKPAMRVKVPDETVSFTDHIMGAYHQNLAQACGDFILRRSDGVFAYQLAVVVDDALMGVNQVVRGVDLLSSTPRQNLAATAVGLSPARVRPCAPAVRRRRTPAVQTTEGRGLGRTAPDGEASGGHRGTAGLLGRTHRPAGAGAGTGAGGGVRLGESETRECRGGVKRCGGQAPQAA